MRFRRRLSRTVVTEIGDNAIVRSTGVATSQQNTANQEAKDFKVVVTVTDPPPDIRPGLSDDGKDHDCHSQQCADDSDSGADRSDVRQIWNKRKQSGSVHAAAPPPAKAHPRITTGIRTRSRRFRESLLFATTKPNSSRCTRESLAPPILKWLNGLKEGDEIVTGSYKVLRTLRPGVT